jgi:hypothetical protein
MDYSDTDSWLENIKTLELTKNEILMLSDSISTLVSHNVKAQRENGIIEAPLRKLNNLASIAVTFEISMEIINAVSMLSNNDKVAMTLTVSDLINLRECCNSRIKYDDEKVGQNLLVKICDLISEDYKSMLNMKFEVSETVNNQITEIIQNNNTKSNRGE